MNDSITTLTILRNLLNTPLIRTLSLWDRDQNSAAEFLAAVYDCGCEESLLAYVQELILIDENPFSLRCAENIAPSELLESALCRDLKIIDEAVDAACLRFRLKKGNITLPFSADAETTVKNLQKFYNQYGYGRFIHNLAYTVRENDLVPLKNFSRITLDDLKDYAVEKEQIERNISGFVQGLPALNMLLYGDKGTGKSSTVRAVAEKYFPSGIRLIELDEQGLEHINEIRQKIAKIPLKFILFIDDLSLNGNDDRLNSLKASLEGSFASGQSNTLIVVTSNRRHLIRETIADRQNAFHVNEALDEMLSLSDRFGLTILFATTNQAQYLSIVRQLAEDSKISMNESELFALAERWALVKGGRSPRHAKQFVDFLYANLSRGINPDF